jgi:hypothetical protein
VEEDRKYAFPGREKTPEKSSNGEEAKNLL